MVKNIEKNQEKDGNSYMNEIKRGLSAVENKNRANNSRKMIEENKLKETRKRLTQQLFMAMKELGFDPSNLESIKDFTAKLSQQDPDLLKIFEAGFGGLQGEEAQIAPNVEGGPIPGQMAPPETSEPSITNNFDNLRNQVFNRV